MLGTSIFSFAGNTQTVGDTSKPVLIHITETKKIDDLKVLVVLDGKIAGTMGEIKNIETIVPIEKIESVNVLKDTAAIKKYGDKGKWGVIEIISTGTFKITDVSLKKVQEDTDKVFEKVEIEASFPGGDATWRRYLERSLNGTVGSNNGAPIGLYTTVVQFMVDKEGNISEVKPLTNHGYGMEAEVVRVLIKGPKWTPAVQGGRMVKAYRKQPVTFLVQDENIEIVSEKLYVFSTGVSNLVSIKVFKVKDEDLDVSISQGTIERKGGGDYEVKVNERGKAIITIRNNKNNKLLGAVYYRVN